MLRGEAHEQVDIKQLTGVVLTLNLQGLLGCGGEAGEVMICSPGYSAIVAVLFRSRDHLQCASVVKDPHSWQSASRMECPARGHHVSVDSTM